MMEQELILIFVVYLYSSKLKGVMVGKAKVIIIK